MNKNTPETRPIIKAAAAIGLALGFMSTNALAATFFSSYTQGAGSQLLSANGGAGSTLFLDGAQSGGDQDPVGNPFAFPAGNSVLFDGTGSWTIGDTVSITGFAMPIRDVNTTNNTFEFTIYEGVGGIGASGAGGLNVLGTATADFTTTTGVTVRYANFDTPITFTADASSTSIGINFGTINDAFGYKAHSGTGATRIRRYNTVNGNLINSYVQVSIAGTVTAVPEPSSIVILGMGSLVLLARRKR